MPLSALVLMVAAFAADAALACGGLFCAQVSPSPVDQSAERILFEVLDDGTVAATVEIRYQGDPSQFSWIVPVRGTPDFIEVAPKDQLSLLDSATAPVIVPPTQQCSNPGMMPTIGCAASAPEDAALSGGLTRGGGDDGVDVTTYPSVGPYDDIVVVEGSDPAVLMGWLMANGYQVTDAMRPYIEAYTLAGDSFLATKLEPNAEVRDIVPIRFQVHLPDPEIPLRLTAIAAEPQMGILVFIAAAGRYGPSNFLELEIDGEDLKVDASGQTNYFALVSKMVDEVDGRALVLERAQPSIEVMPAVGNSSVLASLDPETAEITRRSVDDVLTRRPYLTRLYTRLDPHQMTLDPQFVPTPGAGRFDGNHDLSARIVELCPSADEPAGDNAAPPCGLLYCGADDRCARSDGFGDGCICDDNRTARATTAPNGGVQVACSTLDIDLHGGGAGACASYSCGLGVCVPVNDRPTCACDDDAVAVIRDGLVSCEKRADGPIYDARQVLWPKASPEAAATSDGCSAASRNRAGSILSLLLLFSAPFAARRLMRRRG